jgi:DNA transformation protein and related proteins
MTDLKGDKLFVNLGASQARRRLKGFGHGVRKVQSAGRDRAVIIHTASGRHLQELEAKFADVGFSSDEIDPGQLKSMTPKVIDDLHYNGKTVNERLAADGLFDRYRAAAGANDAATMIELLQQVAITESRATQIATSVLAGPSRSPIHLRLGEPRNAGIVRHFEGRNELTFPPCMLPVECPRDPYWNLGSHPDIVEHLWDELSSALPSDCRSIVFGTPALVAPTSGIVLAHAFGTKYVLRLAPESMNEALGGGAETSVTWAGGQVTDLCREYGDDWIFGGWLEREPAWLLEVYNLVEAFPRES